MAAVSTYLNFPGTTEEAFRFYAEVFGTELSVIDRMGDVPDADLPPEERNLVMHVSLPILAGHVLMGTDVVPSMGQHLDVRDVPVSLMLQPDTVAEAETIFAALSPGATEVMPLQPMFWGDTFGSLVDRFGVRWMFDVGPEAAA